MRTANGIQEESVTYPDVDVAWLLTWLKSGFLFNFANSYVKIEKTNYANWSRNKKLVMV